MKEEIKVLAEQLADLCTDNSLEHSHYNDVDLFNATRIFTHFIFDVVYSENKSLSYENKCKLSVYTGNALRQLIFTVTGKDMHKIAKKLIN